MQRPATRPQAFNRNPVSKRKALSSTAALLGLSGGALGWAGMAEAAEGERALHTLLLPDHFQILDDGTVVFALKSGEQLSLSEEQYVLLDGGLVLVVDELAQAAMAELPVMGSLRTQLLTEIEPVRSPDGYIVEVSSTQPLWSGDGPTPRLFEEIDLKTYEVAQDSGSDDEAIGLNLAGLIAAAPSTMWLLDRLMGTGQTESAISFVSGTTAKAFEQTSGTVYTAAAVSTNAGSISYSISGGLDQTKFSIDPSTGVLTFVAPPSYSSPTDSGGDNVYDLQIEATDSAGDTVQRSLAVQVLEVSGVSGITGGSMANLATAMGKLYYSYDDGSDTELWEYNPNTGIAQEVDDINPGSANDSDPNTLIEYQGDGGALYFKANDGTNEVVHKYDGSSVTAISSLSDSTWGYFLFRAPTEFDGKLYFINANGNQTNSELIEWDGSTVRVIAEMPNWTAAPVGPLGSADGQTLYTGAISYINNRGNELYYWNINSSPNDLTHAASVNVNSSDGSGSHGYAQFLIEYDDSLFYRATPNGASDYELYEYNLTTNSLQEHEIGSTGNHNGLEYASMIVFQDKLYMIGEDDVASTGKELFVFDRSGAPELVMDINPGSGNDGFNNANNPTTGSVGNWWYPTIFNDKLYFVANDGTGSDLWVYDGISEPTKAYDFNTSSIQHLTSLTVLDDTLFFLGDSGGAGATTGTIDLWSIG